MIIDFFNHILPARFWAGVEALAPELDDIGKRMRDVKLLHDLDARFRLMDGIGEDYRQLITVSHPPIEEIADAKTGAELSRIANDSMAELVASHPDRFVAFAASLSLIDIETAVAELRRAVDDLGARAVQIFTNANGRPMDDPYYHPFFQAMADYDLPILMHPARTAAMPDYASEERSRFEAWISLGWPYETAVAMMRFVLTGLFERHPDIKIVTHHMGGMIPFHDARMEMTTRTLGTRSSGDVYGQVRTRLSREPLDYYRSFYGDTAMHGGVIGIKCGLEFFGVEHVVFASDSPFGDARKCVSAIDRLGLDAAEKQKVLCGNAERLLKLRAR